MENEQSVSASKQRIACALGVGHEAEDIAFFIADSRYVVSRSVGVRGVRRARACVAVAKQDPAVKLQAMKDGVIRKIAAFTVSDGNLKNGSRPCGIRERTVVAFDADVDVLANEVQSAISDKRAR